MSGLARLSIKGVVMEEVGAVELLAVGLDHGDPVLPPLEYLQLVHREDVGPGEVALSGDEHLAVSVLQPYGLVVISVLYLIIRNCTLEIENTWNIIYGIQI